MQVLRRYAQKEAKNWWATPRINQFLILLGYILLVLSWVEASMPGGPPGINSGDLLMPSFLICFTLSSALEANRTSTYGRQRAFIWGAFAFCVLFLGWTLSMVLSRS